MNHDIALFVLNSAVQLETKKDQIREAQYIICDPSMDVPPIRTNTGAKLYAYFRADAVGLQGADNPWWNQFRVTMNPYLYQPHLSEPRENAVLIKPSLQSAEVLAKTMIREVAEKGWDGAYLDQCWYTKPPRFINLEIPRWNTGRTDTEARQQIQIRWRHYLSAMFELVWLNHGCPMILNCGGDIGPLYPTQSTIIAMECDGTTRIDDLLATAMYRSWMKHIIWYGGVGLTNRIIEGRML